MTTWRHYETEQLAGGRSRLWYLLDEERRHPVTVNADAVTPDRIAAIGAELARLNLQPPAPPGSERVRD